jgi:hypothetical protein
MALTQAGYFSQLIKRQFSFLAQAARIGALFGGCRVVLDF